jgi:hypothetical protein
MIGRNESVTIVNYNNHIKSVIKNACVNIYQKEQSLSTSIIKLTQKEIIK